MGLFSLPDDDSRKQKIYRGLSESDCAIVVGWRVDSQYWLTDLLIEHGIKPLDIYLVDAFPSNLTSFSKYEINLVHADIRELGPEELAAQFPERSLQNYAFIWEHGPEHVSKTEASNVVKAFQPKARLISIETPLGHYPQGPDYYDPVLCRTVCNPYEEHVSSWFRQDYEEFFPDLDIYINTEGHIGGVYQGAL